MACSVWRWAMGTSCGWLGRTHPAPCVRCGTSCQWWYCSNRQAWWSGLARILEGRETRMPMVRAFFFYVTNIICLSCWKKKQITETLFLCVPELVIHSPTHKHRYNTDEATHLAWEQKLKLPSLWLTASMDQQYQQPHWGKAIDNNQTHSIKDIMRAQH